MKTDSLLRYTITVDDSGAVQSIKQAEDAYRAIGEAVSKTPKVKISLLERVCRLSGGHVFYWIGWAGNGGYMRCWKCRKVESF